MAFSHTSHVVEVRFGPCGDVPRTLLTAEQRDVFTIQWSPVVPRFVAVGCMYVSE